MNSGDHSVPKRKSATLTSPKKLKVSRISAYTIASVVAIETSAAAKRSARTTPSKRERVVGRRTREVRRPIAPGDAAVETSATGQLAQPAPCSAFESSDLALVICSEVSGTIFAASAILSAWATVNSMNALTSGRAIAFSLGYMNSGRESGL